MPPENDQRCGGRKMPTSFTGDCHAEGIEQPVVVVRNAVLPVHRDVQLVGAFDEIERSMAKDDLPLAGQFGRGSAPSMCVLVP